MKNQESLCFSENLFWSYPFLRNFPNLLVKIRQVRSYPNYHVFRLIVSCTGKITRWTADLCISIYFSNRNYNGCYGTTEPPRHRRQLCTHRRRESSKRVIFKVHKNILEQFSCSMIFAFLESTKVLTGPMTQTFDHTVNSKSVVTSKCSQKQSGENYTC